MKKILFYLFLFVIILPWGVQYFNIFPNLLAESPEELNPANIFNAVLNLEPIFRYGNYNYANYTRIFYQLPAIIGKRLFGKTYGIIHITFLLSLGFFGMYRLVRDYFGKNFKNKEKEFIACFISFIFITSPSIFLYLKSGISLIAPAIIFPLQLLLLFFILENKHKVLSVLFLFLSFLSFGYINITVILLNIGFLILFAWGFFRKKYLKTFIYVVICSLPVLLFIALMSLLSLDMAYNPIGGLIESVKEDFYSNQTSILQIFKQTADRGFFAGSYLGLYYDFSIFYRNNVIAGVGVLFGFGLLLFSIVGKNKNLRYFIILILALAVFMLGNKFIVYDYLYNKFTPFQIFRNIQKFAPFLLFLLLIVSVMNGKRNKYLFYGLLGLGVIYNIPYFTYSHSFVKERIVSDISADWKQTIEYINMTIPNNSKMLMVPSVYINELYNFKSGSFGVGVMTDRFTNIHGYRLSPSLIGDYFMQTEMGKLFVEGNTVYGKKIDLSKIDNFLDKFHISYILVTKDVIQNYENAEEYIQFFDKNQKYKKVYKNSSHIIYQRKISNGFSFIGNNITFQENKFGNISLTMTIAGKSNLFSYLEPFHPGWRLYLEPYSIISCENFKMYTGTQAYYNNSFEEDSEYFSVKGCFSEKENSMSKDFLRIFSNSVFDENHNVVFDYANGRILDAEYIKKHFPKKYYKENQDGSIDIHLTLYFTPQFKLYLSWMISCLVFIGSLGGLIVFHLFKKKNT